MTGFEIYADIKYRIVDMVYSRIDNSIYVATDNGTYRIKKDKTIEHIDKLIGETNAMRE